MTEWGNPLMDREAAERVYEETIVEARRARTDAIAAGEKLYAEAGRAHAKAITSAWRAREEAIAVARRILRREHRTSVEGPR